MKRHFDSDFIDRVRSANDIVSVISDYVNLKRKGKNYWGCCPFHNEKTPSFSVSPEKGFYHCFGCKASGNVFNFLMNHEHIGFAEAVERLASRAGLPLPVVEQTPEELAKERYREKLYEVNDLGATFFHNCLTKTSMGEKALAYLQDRGLTMDTIVKFRLGFAPDSWDKLYQAFTKRGIEEKVLLDLGLCRQGNNGKVYDYFRNRVMFPICNGRGKVVGFGGRVLDQSEPKYLNSQETELFNKRHLLFAFDKAYRSIREKKQAILVEGYMDVISSHNRGITNVVASLGTAFTKEQGNLLIRQAEEIVLAYDMDGAGQKAAKRAIELTSNMDFKVRVLAMPDGKDPDDYVRNHGPQAFTKLIESAVSPFEYLVNSAMVHFDNSSLEGKLQILEEVFPYIASIEERAKREDLLKLLAMPLWLDNSTVFRYFREYLEKGQMQINTVEEGPRKVDTKSDKTADALLSMAFSDVRALQRVQEYVPSEDFPNTLQQALYKKAALVMEETGNFSLYDFEKSLSTEEGAELSRIMIMSEALYDEATLDGYIRALRIRSLQNQFKEHSLLADKLNRANDETFILELQKCQAIQEEIKQWS